jgi:hypothetical protein
MKRKRLTVTILLFGLGLGGSYVGAADPSPTIPVAVAADYLHAILEADRTFYTVHVVDRLQREGVVNASEDWRATKKALPLPAQFFKESSQLAAITGTKIIYRLIALAPINPENKPVTEFERLGLEQVMAHPERPHTGIVTTGDTRAYHAIYADYAVSESCVGCHNAHPRSPKRDFKVRDVMGAIEIMIPLE